MTLFATLVAISIAGLAFRRVVLRPIWLGAGVSLESAFIALLIFVLRGNLGSDGIEFFY